MDRATKVLTMKAFPVSSSAGRSIFALTVGVTLTVMSPAVWAQMGMPGGSPMRTPGTSSMPKVGNDSETPTTPPPDAIPGAKARVPAAPASKAVADLPPTDALFDAINRGDIAAARDALSRGADLNGVNILGMTPMELSVDLGRNDISFLLLSMRGEDSNRGSRAPGRDTASPAPVSKTAARAGKGRAASGDAARVTKVAVTAKARPKLFANDGGTPLPSAGFLGFDPRSASN